MVARTAEEALANARADKTCRVGWCLWYVQEWLRAPHVYPSAAAQWRAAKYRHPGDRRPPKGAPVFWTGGSKGFGHVAISTGGGTVLVRSTDQTATGRVSEVSLTQVERSWGNLTYAGWTEDLGGVDIPYLRGGGRPGNPHKVKAGDVGVVLAQGVLNGRAAPQAGAPVVTTKPTGAEIPVAEVVDGWARDGSTGVTASSAGIRGAAVPRGAWLQGWDVSSNNDPGWQPRAVETFGWVKCTEGRTYRNPDYAQQLAKARARGQVVGHYHWLVKGNTEQQLQWFLANVDLQPGDMVALDWEDDSAPPSSEKDAWIMAAQTALPGHRVGLYCNRDWWWNRDTSSFAGDYLWIAKYGGDDPGIEHQWLFWQHTSVPMDRNYARFGSVDELRAWALGKDAGAGVWYSTDYLEPAQPPVVWPQETQEPVASDYWVTAALLNGRTVDGTVAKQRPVGFHIDTPERVVLGGDLNPSEEGQRRWLRTRAGYFYALDYLTTEAPVTANVIKVATWNPYRGNSIANMRKGVRAIIDTGVAAIGMQELSDDGKQRALTAFVESLGWRATRRNSAVTSFYDPAVLDVDESYELVEKGGRAWESGAGGDDSIYKIIMLLDGRVKADGHRFALLNHHLVPTVEAGGRFRGDKPIRVSIYKRQIAAVQEQVRKRGGLVFVTADQNVDWGTPAGDWVEKQYDEVGLTVCWDEAPDKATHTSNRTIDWTAVKGGTVVDVEVLDNFGSDHRPVICTVNY